MSEYEAENFMERMEKWDDRRSRHDFIAKMERKLNRKERYSH